MARHRVRKKPMAEINVVPYIDVMLVMLVIFMVTAPLLTQGVQVDLPQADAKPVDDMIEVHHRKVLAIYTLNSDPKYAEADF